MAKHKAQELQNLYTEGETADQELFAEQRSNVQLIAGDHYAKRGTRFWNRVRAATDLTNEQKIRLTKNHIRKIAHIYRNAITSYAPGVMAKAKDESSQQSQKAAELVNAVWADAKAKFDLTRQINLWASDYIGIGEVAVKIFFDPMAGKFQGFEQALDEFGQPQVDENGQPVASENAKFSGDVVFERIFGFNLIRPSNCKDIAKAEWLCIRKMADINDLKNLIESNATFSDEEKQRLKSKVTETTDQTYVVMDNNSGRFKTTKNQAMLKEFYFRPCSDYPQGYFYITTSDEILFEGELPFGIFPIVFQGFDEIQTSCRYRSVIKQLRPYQIEINRTASQIAETQVTLGWDKVLVQNGTKLEPGMAFPGVRSFSYSGVPPVVMEGRTGSQYLEYMSSQISEMYQIAMVEEQMAEKDAGGFDVYAILSRSLRDKKKFSLYTDGFESFLKNIFKTYISLKQKYSSDDDLVPAIGKSEYINIPEFKNVEDIFYSVVPESQSDDMETKLGKQLMLNHIIQYVGPQLQKDDIGKIIRLMPYANEELILQDLTMDYDIATNYILMLDRGQFPDPNIYDNHEYLIKKFTARMRQPDFQFLPEQIKQNYTQAVEMHETLLAEQAMKIKQAQSQFIPSGGYLVACDMYTADPNAPDKLPKRIRIPSEALNWLLEQLRSQGSAQDELQNLNQGVAAQISDKFMQGNQQAVSSQGVPLTAQASAQGA